MARSHLLAHIRLAGRASDGVSDADLLGRFVADADQDAFAELVRRYARLVWGQCRNLLANEADADDAFQATFLALAKSARTVRDTALLGPWLHAVAHRVCLNARRAAARRTQRERRAAVREGGRPVADSAWEVAAAAVHEEVNRLPEPLRVAFVLCHLEGKSPTLAAAQLGLSHGTFSSRLSRAKQRLLDRLSARGIGAVVAVATLGGGTTASAEAVARAIGLGIQGVSVPASVLSLLPGVVPMSFVRAKLLAALAVVLAGMAGLLAAGDGPEVPPPPRAAKPEGNAPKLDLHGDPLPDKAVLRLGTEKFRVPNLAGVGFKKTGELVALTEKLELHTFPADGSPKATVTKLLDKSDRTYWRAAISADARFAAAHVEDKKKLVVWDITGAKPVEHMTRDMADAYTIAFSPDGRWLAVNDTDRNQALPLLLYDVAKKSWESFPVPRGNYIEQFTFTTDGKWLAATTGDQVTVIETATAKTQVSVSIPRTRLSASAVSPDGKTVVAVPTSWLFGKDPTVKFFTTDNGGDAEGLTGPTAKMSQVGYLPDGKTLWTSYTNHVREWDPVSGKWLREATVPTDWRKPPVWSPDGKRFVTHNSKTLAIVDAKTWKPLNPESLAAGPVDAVFGVTVSPDGKVIATDGEVIHLWDAATGKLRGTVKSTWGNQSTMAFLPDSKAFVAVVDRNIPAVCDAATGKELRRLKLPAELEKKVSLKDLRLSRDGKTLTAFAESASSQWKSLSLRWGVEKGEVNGQVEEARRDDDIFGTLRSPDGGWVAQRGSLTRSGVADKEPITVVPADEAGFGFNSGVWSPDSTRVAMTRAIGPQASPTAVSMVVYDLARKAKVAELATGRVLRAAFTHDCKFLATMTRDHVAVWELATSKEVFRAESNTGNMTYARAIAFTPDGKRLITGHDTTALVWDVSAATGGKPALPPGRER